MKKFYPANWLLILITVILSCFSDSLHSQTALSFTAIPYSEADLNAPGRGVEQWHNGNEVNVPLATTSTPRLDKYYRFSWNHFETTQGNYTWSAFDGQINAAISSGQKFSFGVMTCCPGCEGGWTVSYGGASSAYPQYLHNLMQAEPVKDWNSGGTWVPNYNSESYLSRLLALNQAIYNHIQNTSYNGVRYRDVVSIIDIRGYGSWGEWHSGAIVGHVNEYPAGTFPTVATLKRIVDAHTQGFPDIPLVAMIAAFDANYLGIVMNPPEIGYYILTTRNNWGPIGWRRDQWGATDAYLESYLVNNTRTFNGVPLNSLIMERWKTSPITGEPPGWATDYNILESQIRLYHASSFGNGNYGGADPNSIGNNIRASSKAAGYRLVLEGGSLNSSITTGTPTPLTLNWKNVGIAPTYENWDVVFELKNSGGTTVWSGTSSFKLKLFLPQTTSTAVTDNITIPTSVAAGTYSLNLIIKDPNGYRKPLPLAIRGVNADGSYTLRSVTVSSGTGQTNNPPVAAAGADRAITLPTNSASLAGSGTDADGTIASYLWEQLSGPSSSTLSATNAANITVSNLQAGTYTYRLTVTDDDGATDTDEVIVTVANAIANQAPVANAGANKIITLPTSSTTLSGSGSTDPDGTIASYQWQQVNGPSTSNLSATNTASITVSNLQSGIYTFRLTVTDNGSATSTDDVTVTVNAPANQAPIADAGANKTITLPTNSTTLSGSGSSDPDGTIAGYQWQQVSGPSTSTLSAINTVNITVSNLQAGTYTYRLTVTDNSDASDNVTVTVTVNNAPVNQAPVANAGANRTITLPVNSVNLTGSGTDADGTISGYQWLQVSGPSASTFSAANTANITVSNLVAGVYTYRLTVTDNGTATGADEVTVTVNAAPNQAPVATAGANRTITLPTSSTTLSGGGSSDADGTITSYQWQQVSGPSASTFSATNTANITVSNLQVGLYTYRITVTDNNGATDTDDVTVTVNSAPNQAPSANAGANKIITLPTNSTTLSGTGTDPDGTIAAYQWQQVSGPSASGLSATNIASITVNNLLAGVYTYRLTVRDNAGATSTDDVTVSVNAAPNQAPVANAGANKSITLPTSSTTLTGIGTDADGTIAGYQWQQVSGPSASTFSATNTANITVSNLQVGLYTYRITVTDNNGATDIDDVTVTVNAAPNQAPSANAGANKIITLPTNSTTLSGIGVDPDGTIAAYQWQQVSGPSASGLSATNIASITVNNLQAGVYTYRLTVRDNAGATATDDVTVTVNAAPNQAPVANAGANKSITLPPNSTTLTGSGTDADGTIAAYQWQQLSGPSASTLSATNTAGITVSNLLAGVYIYRLTVTDNDGAVDTDDVTVTVNNAPVNEVPNANAGANRIITLPTRSTTLSGSGTDADGTIASYFWQQVSGPSASTLSATNTAGITVSNLQAGVYTYRLTVTDNDGAANTDDVTVTVNNAPNQAPLANAGANKSITLPVNSTTLGGSGTDVDGTIASYLWQQVGGPSASTLSATNTAGITVSNLQAGIYTYRLTVTDNNGAAGTDNVTVTVANPPANLAPNANAGPNITITLPASSATLSGSGTDADGTIASYLWQQVSGPSASTLSATNTAGITISNLQAGLYSYRLTVTDNDGATDVDLVNVTVNPAPKKAPKANAGSNKSVTLPTNSTSLTGAASTDEDGTIVSYRWQQVSGPSPSTLTSASAANTNITNLQTGEYTFSLTVTDNDNTSDEDLVTVTVNVAPNQAPVANAGANRVITLPTNSTSLNGSVSADADGTIASYQWQQVSGPSTSVLSATNTANISVSNLVAGAYTYRLTVTDNDNATATDEVTVTVNNQPNEAPIANAGTNLIITLPTNSASLSGSGLDVDGTIAGYQWQQISGPSASNLSATNTANITVTNLQAGLYIYRLTVRDDDNATGTDNVTITVNIAPPNQAPVANAGVNKVITLPTNNATLSGSASTDTDGTIASYLWQQVSGPSTSTLSATNTVNITVSNLQQGVYSYRLTVRDNDNATSVATVTVTVNALANLLPIADAGTDQTIVVTANTTTLSAEQSTDPDGTITSYTWQQVSGPGPSVFSATSGKTVDVSNLLVGEYTYRLTVRDNKNATATSIVKVTVIDNFRNYTTPVVVYPNPATEVINIRLLSDKPGRVQINIYDMSGKAVISPLMVNKPAGAYSVPVTISSLKYGTYVVQITTFGHKKISATFIKL